MTDQIKQIATQTALRTEYDATRDTTRATIARLEELRESARESGGAGLAHEIRRVEALLVDAEAREEMARIAAQHA